VPVMTNAPEKPQPKERILKEIHPRRATAFGDPAILAERDCIRRVGSGSNSVRQTSMES
jgi:hypothetical protein